MNLQLIKNSLGKPYFETDDCLLYAGDCLELMKKVDSSLVDLTVTSPPYNIGKEYEEPMPLENYLDWCKDWISEIHRVTKNQGAFWLNIGYLEIPEKGKAVPIPYLLWDKTPFYFIQEVIWNYGAGVAGRKFFSPRNEKLLWYVKDQENYVFNLDDIRDKNVKYPNQKKNGKLKCNPLGKNPTDVWQIPKVTSGANRSSKERMPHPAQFPIALIDRIVKASSNTDEVVLDPFLGSGTSAIVALSNKRKFIGFEINEKYCDLAVERIKQYKNSPQPVSLFEFATTTQLV
ncbi:MAG: modification methylase [Candidatus Taylorbacteria bacterium RIFCSPLOWO2_02_FULL_43_11]|uniref:Methyltransferase n=1 Tax=Candidatus Taylorbacteria bacterium RIFCSPHIGHO2_02_FULL_43_32b TaxID=1802306 RepID=A0A1G2MMA0_9BACT|nr:MAG: modification methylase [Candidatus Taylorbacteria bacterium RIFCSPHIGHO2_01_FULL_43_47]OHA24874.1 MAG: modification methylase [Candidatus Taylorbacteria bacterium RIFCSPHIGHO2_02_FULL_43_32b]OHA37393.1 MAG: modification methylase [Candidatus Taylorbacteria bacterium RIFCSPLOWO2_02_FULL_43_11]